MPMLLRALPLCLIFLLHHPGGARAEKTASDIHKSTESLTPQMRLKIAENARQFLLDMGISYKPFDPLERISENQYYKFSFDYMIEDRVRDRQRDRFPAVQVAEDGTFAAPVVAIDWNHVESVVAITPDGKEHAARLTGYSRRGNLVWFQSDDLRRPLPPCRHQKVSAGEEIVAAWLYFDDIRRKVEVDEQKIDEILWFDKTETERKLSGYRADLDEMKAFFDKRGDWIGILPGHPYIESDSTWRIHPSELAEDRIPRERLETAAARAAKDLEMRLPVIHLRFREKVTDKSSDSYLDEDKDYYKERDDIGVPIKGGLILIPRTMERDSVKQLESIAVTTDGRSVPARFIGVLKELNGYLVNAEKPLEGLVSGKFPAPPKDGDLFIAHAIDYFGGRAQFRFHPEYFMGHSRTYKDFVTRRPGVAEDAPFSIFTDVQGKPFGIWLDLRRFEAETEKNPWGSRKQIMRFFSLAQLDEYFNEPQSLVDPLVQPVTVTETKKKAWLGVETHDITPDLATALKMEPETQDGTHGQMISFVYPDSPASRLGLVPGDVILKFKEKEKREEVFVQASHEDSNEDGKPWWRTWFIRKTPLKEALSQFSVGSKVLMTYAHNHALHTTELVLEEGPPSFESAPKTKDERTGLTVKDLTYEVLNILRLGNMKGALVYEVESGSPADIAQISPIEVVQEVNGKPVKDRADFLEILKKEEAKGSNLLRMRLRYIDDTYYVDVKLPPKTAEPAKAPEMKGASEFPEVPNLEEPPLETP